MQVTFGINMVALDHGQPRLFNLKEIIEAFVLHRREVVTRRSIFELRKARERTHILEGLAVARSNIDEMIAIIRNSKTVRKRQQQSVHALGRYIAILLIFLMFPLVLMS